MNELLLAVRALEMAQLATPFDTGNLAFNSIILQRQPRGFRLISLGNVARYNTILETGTKFTKVHRNWWSQGVTGAISRYIDGYYNNRFDGHTAHYPILSARSKDNPARNQRFLKEISR